MTGEPPGVGAPARTPADVIDKLNKEINAGLADAKIRARLADVGGVPMPMTPAEFAKFSANETYKPINGQRSEDTGGHSPALGQRDRHDAFPWQQLGRSLLTPPAWQAVFSSSRVTARQVVR